MTFLPKQHNYYSSKHIIPRWCTRFFDTRADQIFALKLYYAQQEAHFFLATLLFILCLYIGANWIFYRPPKEMGKGNAFSHVRLSVCLSTGSPMWPLPMMHWTSLYRPPDPWPSWTSDMPPPPAGPTPFPLVTSVAITWDLNGSHPTGKLSCNFSAFTRFEMLVFIQFPNCLCNQLQNSGIHLHQYIPLLVFMPSCVPNCYIYFSMFLIVLILVLTSLKDSSFPMQHWL